MIGLAEKTLPELEAMAAALRAEIARSPGCSPVSLQDVEWEIEKRLWRSHSPKSPEPASKDSCDREYGARSVPER